MSGQTVNGLIRSIAQFLTQSLRSRNQAETVGLDSRLIVAAALGIAHENLVLRGPEPINDSDVERAFELAGRRADGEPIARLLGRKEFWSLDLAISPAVLVPRPDTETLVAAAFDWADRAGRREDPLRIVDLGTGSGAILLALLSELPNATGLAVDIDPAALAVARNNADSLGFGDRVVVLESDWGKGVQGVFDLVVSNPPYIETAVIETLDVEVRRHDPRLALDGGADGLTCYRTIIAGLPKLLAPDGAVFLEAGAGQAESVAWLLAAAGLKPELHRDLAGIERVVAGTRA